LGRGGSPILTFALGTEYELTEIKVVPLAEWKTNRLVLPLWHLVSDGTDPLNHFFYGQNIRDMDAAVEGSQAQPLETNVTYRIFVSAGSEKGWHDFQVSKETGMNVPAPRRRAIRPNR
jgi:hypothetical protein